jgi:CDP-paratose 2-epimerase
MKSVLVTGGAGFVGSSLALHLKRTWESVRVVCLDNLYRKGSELNVGRLEKAGIRFVRADVRDRKALLDLGGFDLFVDAAAEPSVLAGQGGHEADYVVDTNLGGTVNVLEAARRCSGAVLFLSTSRVYPVEALRRIAVVERGDRFEIADLQGQPGLSRRGVAEEFPLKGARTLYGATKYASEVMVSEYAAQFGIRALINRCGVIAGPWQMGRVDQGVIALWVARHFYGRPLTYMGYGGRQVRDVLHVQDLCELVVMQLAGINDWTGDVYNVGGGRSVSVSLRELTALAAQAAGFVVPVKVDDTVRPGDVPLYLTDSSRVSARWGWQPRRAVEEIVRDTMEWIRNHADSLRPVLDA